MTKTLLASAGLLALAAGVTACNVHDNTLNATAIIPNAMIAITADTDVDNVMPAQPVPMTVTVQNVYLVEPSATVPPEHEMDAGHFEFHVDDETKPAVLVTAQTHVEVPIPADTKPGHHKVICRLHKHNGEATTTKFEIDINVKVAVTSNGDGGVTVDATVTVEAGPAPADAATND